MTRGVAQQKAPDPAVIRSFEEQFGTARPFDEQEIVTRVLLPMGMEMARCLEEVLWHLQLKLTWP